jgi:arylsulfatase A-like enzyme
MRYVQYILIITAGVIAAFALGFYAFWAVLFFPGDYSVTREEALQRGTGRPGQVLDVALLDRIDGAALTGDFSRARIEELVERIKKGSLPVKGEAYSRAARRHLLARMGTGHPGIWLDERSSLVLPSKAEVSFTAEMKEDADLDFSALAPLGGGALHLRVVSPGKAPLEKTIRLEWHRQRFTAGDVAMKRINRGYVRARDDLAWMDQSISLAPYAGSRAVISFRFEGDDDGAALIANPGIFAASERRRYNVIYIIFDGVANRLWSFYNDDSGLTPFMKEAADNDFIVFDNMFTLGDKTRISTTGLFCSVMPFATRHGINRNFIPENEIEIFYDRVRGGVFQPLPDLFRRSGYVAQQFGNSGFTVQLLSTGVDYGFERSYEFSYNPYDSYGISHRFFDFLRNNGRREFFTYLHYNTPHKPFYAPAHYYLKGVIGSPTASLWRPDFMGCLSYTDDVFRNLYQAFKTHGLLDNSIIVVATDHGSGFDLSKFDAGFQYADYTRMTFMLHLPPDLKKRLGITRKRVGTYVSQINIAPTLAELAGIAPSGAFRGKSFVSLLTEQDERKFFDDEIWSFGRKTFSIIRPDLFKYILTFDEEKRFVNREYAVWGLEREVPFEQLYDLNRDPYEKTNLVSRRRDVLHYFRRAVLERDLHHPERNILAFFPEPGKKHRIEVRVRSRSGMLQAGLFGKDLENSREMKTRAGASWSSFEFDVDQEPLYCVFELEDDRAPLGITILADGSPVAKEDIFATPLGLNLYGNPVRLEGIKDFLMLNSISLPAAPVRHGGEKAGLSVVVSRMDLHRWIDVGRLEQKSISAGMKQTLKSWGYIQ